ncbi:glycine N-acyltransferase-like protein 3 [Synchiropus splendidus]|uniref:glycine N-acyltransferase-like protein 3 n=1 Tax=Synchiropus splendidus TaxID=270530 RepID=UPI00237D738F|nr:glycine N-acyltransferase-like protein 3 [Synchiropus splendidus]XP_053731102.1 glycine N-acyltransferase-like protein 3 [Synchiropus splendidus]XP_053731103.1 glycine N-acyltransferase-like protein 3 [Synchiropus splendidus]XP_053731104.1 glycine N-acyltransferase-like protein 3 [Synchiropus splendidus]XP_053731105.1 glycine N-acyltransferase-like protein 3 [Synchiropus splendidus]
MELNEEQLKLAEKQLKKHLPLSQNVYGALVMRNRVSSDPLDVIVDTWPDFRVIICRPQVIQREDLFKDSLVFTTDSKALEELVRRNPVFDWTQFLCLGTNLKDISLFKTLASEKKVPCSELAICHMMTLTDVNKLPPVDSTGVRLASLTESHIQLVNQTWKFSEGMAETMIRNMIRNFPSKCVLDERGQPVSWILTYNSSAMGMLYTLPEHRGKGYAKILISTMARSLHSEGYPVYCSIEEKNLVSYRLFQKLGFTEDPEYRAVWYGFNSLT